jgi:hypothetical protein
VRVVLDLTAGIATGLLVWQWAFLATCLLLIAAGLAAFPLMRAPTGPEPLPR